MGDIVVSGGVSSGTSGIDAKANYGATGDGVTDDTTAVAAALAAGAGKTVYFPAGTYLVGNLVAPVGGVRVIGAGPAVTVLKAATGTTGVLLDLTYAANTANSEVRDISIDCQNAITMTGLRADRTNRLFVHDVNFRYGAYGFEFVTRAGVGPFTVDTCNFQNHNTAAIHYTGSSGSGSAGYIARCLIQVTDGTTQLTQGILIDYFTVGLLVSNINILCGTATNLIHSGIVYTTAVPTGGNGAFLSFSQCIVDAVDTGNGLDLTNARQVQSVNNFWGCLASSSKDGVAITGGRDLFFSNDWISGRGMSFATAPNRISLTNCTFPQTATGGALVMPGGSPPTLMTLANNTYYTSITNTVATLDTATNYALEWRRM